jgi:hypothetical protein
MNAFYEHHAYRCFDRILLHATIQPLQQEQRAIGFFWSDRSTRPLKLGCIYTTIAIFSLPVGCAGGTAWA